MMMWGIGRLRLQPADFWELTFCELSAMIAAYNEQQVEQYRHTRLIMYAMFNSQPRKRPVRLEEILQLPGDGFSESDEQQIMEHLAARGIDIEQLKKRNDARARID